MAAVEELEVTRVWVPPRYHTIGLQTHVELAGSIGGTEPRDFNTAYGSALHRRINQGFHGKVHLKMGCVVCSDVLVRGDIGSGSVDIGKFVVIGESVLIRPPMRHNPEKNAVDIVPVVIGEHVFIGQNTVSEASRIGSCTVIEANCIIGANVEVNHCVWLKANSVVPRDSKLMPFGVYEGHPARLVGQINPDSGLVEMREVVLDAIRRTGLLSAE
jgi:carbonic anhydrase/acetyltransferase-like protein (isoleucine patch superfamily)